MLFPAVFLVLVFAYCLVSERLAKTVVTAPLLFAAAGALYVLVEPERPPSESAFSLFLFVAELGLVLLLFTDASRTDLRVLRAIRELPIRLLGVGMLLTIVLGALGALVVFGELSLVEAGILAAILAPTDAGLGQVIVTSPLVPLRIRQALNVEAGLNDGLSVPFLLFFLTFLESSEAGAETSLVRFIVEQLGYGTVLGIAIGLVGGKLLGLARRAEWMAESLAPLGLVALPLLCLIASHATGASPFIAAFVAGLVVNVGFPEASKKSVEFTEEWGHVLNLAVFFFFGFLVARAVPKFEAAHVAYAALSLTAVRMLPVSISLVGSRLSGATHLFMGWFGPRGLASIVLGLVFLEKEARSPGEETIRLAVMATVALSIVAHGLSAQPGLRLYARRVAALEATAPERARLE